MKITATSLDAYKLFHDGILALGRAEQQGMRIDMEYTERKKKHLTRQITQVEEKFKDTKFVKHWQHYYGAKFNMYSDHQLSQILYKVRKITPTKLTVGKRGSTDNEALTQLNIPELELLLKVRKLAKLRDTYLEGFSKGQTDRVLHPSFNLHTARTYRSSSSDPNFQNIPKRDKEAMKICRGAILPRPGHQLVTIDFKGIEISISACYHKDPAMLRYLNNPKSDLHADLAKQIFRLESLDKTISEHDVLRNAAKNSFVFPQFYGDYYGNCVINLACRWGQLSRGRWKPNQGIDMPDGKLSDHLISQGIKSFNKFTNHIKEIEKDFWGNRFPIYKQWKDRWWVRYQKRGYLDMLTGFRCKGFMERNDAINYPVQGAAFHCLLWSFIEIDKVMRKENWDSRLIGQIHDEIVMDIAPEERDYVLEIVERIMTKDLLKAWTWIIVPLAVNKEVWEIDQPWSGKEES